MIIKIPAKPWNNAPSPNPPVKKIRANAANNPTNVAPPTKMNKKRAIGISSRLTATCQIGILSILKPPNRD